MAPSSFLLHRLFRFGVTLVSLTASLLLSASFLVITPSNVPLNQQNHVTINDQRHPCSLQYKNLPVAEELCQRRLKIEEACANSYPRRLTWFTNFQSNKFVNRIFPHNFLVNEKTKILYCSIPKVASTTWRSYFNDLADSLHSASSNSLLDENDNSSVMALRSLSEFSPQQVHDILANYTKIVWIRDPLQRLVSAWRDKLARNNSYYSKAVGSVIISRYRANATLEEIEAGFPSTLNEFFQYLNEEPVRYFDVHWKSQVQTCHLCKIHWDFYGSFENMQQESDFILRQSLLQANIIPQQHRQIRESSLSAKLPKLPVLNRAESIYSAVLQEIPGKLLENVLERAFKLDFKILGYPWPAINATTTSPSGKTK